MHRELQIILMKKKTNNCDRGTSPHTHNWTQYVKSSLCLRHRRRRHRHRN